MLLYNSQLEKLTNEKKVQEFQASIIANRLKQDIEGVDTKRELKKQYTIIFKCLVVVSLFSNLMFLFIRG